MSARVLLPALRCRSAVLACWLLALPAAPGHALELTRAALDTRWEYGRATDESTDVETAVTLQPRLVFSFTDTTELSASARLRADAADRLEPGTPDQGTYSDGSRPWNPNRTWTAELRDLFVEWRPGTALVRVGKQQIVWGALDGLKILDVLNPQDFREFILEDFGDSRIGLWSVYLELVGDAWRGELALIPDPTVHELPEPDAWFAFAAPRFRFGFPVDQPATLPVQIDRPAKAWQDGTAAVRLSRFLGRSELTLVAASGLDFEPLGRIDAVDQPPTLVQSYPRRELYGASLETAVGGLTVRGEVSWQPDKAFNTVTPATGGLPFLETTELDQYRAAIAADFNGPWGWFVNAQVLVDRVRDAPDSLIRPRTDRVATLFLRRQFDYDRIGLELRWYTEMDQRDELFRGAVSWRPSQNLELTLAVDAFSGTQDGLFGQFADADRVTLTLERTF